MMWVGAYLPITTHALITFVSQGQEQLYNAGISFGLKALYLQAYIQIQFEPSFSYVALTELRSRQWVKSNSTRPISGYVRIMANVSHFCLP